MSPRITIGIASLCVALTGLIVSNLFWFVMIGEVNRQRQEGKLVSYFGSTGTKMGEIYDEYRRKYPNGHAHIYMMLSFAAAVIGFVTFGICTGIIG
jgi:hypothetical protein